MILALPLWAGVDFDDVDDFIDVGALGNFGTNLDTNKPSVSYWIKTTETGDNFALGVRDTSGGGQMRLDSRLNFDSSDANVSGTLQGFLGDTTGNLIFAVDTDTGFNDGNWHNIVLTYDGPNDVGQIFVDGVSQTIVYQLQTTGTSFNNWPHGMYIGAFNNNGSSLNVSGGIITEVAIWDTLLVQADVDLLASSRVKRMPLQVQPTNLIGYWPIDDEEDGTSADGDTFLDLSGNGNDGTGDDGANNTGLTAKAEEILSYP